MRKNYIFLFIILGAVFALFFGVNLYNYGYINNTLMSLFSAAGLVHSEGFLDQNINPAGFILNILLIKYLNAWPSVLTALSGMMFGCVLWLMFKIYLMCFKKDTFYAVLALFTFMASFCVQMLSASAISFWFVMLLALWAVFFAIREERPLMAGAAAGLAGGMIQPFIILIPGLLFIYSRKKDRLLFSLSSASAFLLLTIPWILFLYRKNIDVSFYNYIFSGGLNGGLSLENRMFVHLLFFTTLFSSASLFTIKEAPAFIERAVFKKLAFLLPALGVCAVFAHLAGNVLVVYIIFLFAACPMLVFFLGRLPRAAMLVALAAVPVYFFFADMPQPELARIYTDKLITVDAPYEIKNATVIYDGDNYSHILPFLGRSNFYITAGHAASVQLQGRIYYISEEWKPFFLEGRQLVAVTQKVLPGPLGEKTIHNCMPFSTETSLFTSLYPIVCEVK